MKIRELDGLREGVCTDRDPWAGAAGGVVDEVGTVGGRSVGGGASWVLSCEGEECCEATSEPGKDCEESDVSDGTVNLMVRDKRSQVKITDIVTDEVREE